MFVCVCNAVSDRDIQRSIEGGACSTAEIMACTGAGTKCGTCRPQIATMLASATASAPTSRRSLEVLPMHRAPA